MKLVRVIRKQMSLIRQAPGQPQHPQGSGSGGGRASIGVGISNLSIIIRPPKGLSVYYTIPVPGHTCSHRRGTVMGKSAGSARDHTSLRDAIRPARSLPALYTFSLLAATPARREGYWAITASRANWWLSVKGICLPTAEYCLD